MSSKQSDSKVIGEKIKQYINDRKISKEFHLLKDRPQKGKGGINHRLIERLESKGSIDKNRLEEIKKSKKAKEHSDIDFQREKYRKLLKLFPDFPPDIVNEYQESIKKINDEHNICTWLDIAAQKAGGRSFATHVIKLTHSSITSSASSFFDTDQSVRPKYVTTSSLRDKDIDITGNAGVSHYTALLDIEYNKKSLRDYILESDNTPFKECSEDNKRLSEWIAGFKEVFNSKKPGSHSLAKQTYFLVDSSSDKYHLLLPVISSSLAHSVYKKTKKHDVDDEIKDAKGRNKFHIKNLINFPKKAVLKVTASRDAHRNVSTLHVERNGEQILFSTQPPTWQSQLNPPMNKTSLFDELYNSTIKTEVDYLRDFLLRFNRLDLSIKDPKRMQHLERWVNTIIDEFLFYVGTIQNLLSGWSDTENIRLKKTHQYLLDPYRVDEAFQSARQSTDWPGAIRADFAQWLNRQLRGKDKQFTAQLEHPRLWIKLLEQPLREFMEPIESEIKQRMREAS